MKTSLLIIASIFSISACGGGGGTAATPTPPVVVTPPPVVVTPPVTPAIPSGGIPTGWKQVWADEFDKDGLPDPSKWDYDTERNKLGWFNNEKQYYSRDRLENARVANGKLIITALKEKLTGAADYGGQSYTSSRMLTRGKASWTYGFFEIRAKFSCGLGTWPAIWMLGTKGVWPDDGEIDIMEHVGKNKGQILGSAYSAAYNWNVGTGNTKQLTVSDACDAFHNYQLRWDENQLNIGVDDKYYFQFVNPKDGDYRKWPFLNPQFLILNLAIGGDLGGPVDDSIFPAQMEVEYVRVYQK